MFKKFALVLIIAAAACGEASAHGFHNQSSYYHYNYSYPGPAYGPIYAAPAPVVYYRVPIYIVPATYSVPVQPNCGAVPTISSVRYHSTPHRSVLRIRSW